MIRSHREPRRAEVLATRAGRDALNGESNAMDMSPPPAIIELAQAETAPQAPVEPTPVKIDVSKYIPEGAVSVTMIVTVTPPTGAAHIYAPGYENQGTLFKGPKSLDEVRLHGPFLFVKLYGGATNFDIQYMNYRQP